jgi:hypothetical protein
MSGAGQEKPPEPRCGECGAHEAHEFGGRWLCADCLQIAGSSCAPGDDGA